MLYLKNKEIYINNNCFILLTVQRKYSTRIFSKNMNKLSFNFGKIALTNKLALPPGDKMIFAPLIGQKDKQIKDHKPSSIIRLILSPNKYFSS